MTFPPQSTSKRWLTFWEPKAAAGRVEVVQFNFPEKLARVRWKNGVLVRNRKGKTPVCHFGRGILTVAVSEILGANCESIEVECQGKGDRFCEAVIGEPREIDRVVDTRSD